MRAFDHLVLAVDDLNEAADFYQSIGFTLTPMAHHPFGTSNRLVQMGSTFLELVSVTRPELIPLEKSGDFNFPKFNQDFLSSKQGFSMLALTSEDSDADRLEFSRKNVTLYNPFEFTRLARQPDGRDVTVGFKLTFVSDSELPNIPAFTCHHQHGPEFFWKPDYQRHANGARDVVSISVTSDDVKCAEKFISALDLDTEKAIVDILPENQGGTHYSGFMVAVDDLKTVTGILKSNAVIYSETENKIKVVNVFGVDVDFVQSGYTNP